MKKEFIGFYNPTKTEIEQSWNAGFFVFDTNTLLNLYRYTETTKNDFLNVLRKLKDRLYIPYQAALEFHSNRQGVIQNIYGSYDAILDSISTNFEKNLKSQLLQFKKHPTILVDNIIKLHEDFYKKVSDELTAQKKNHPEFEIQDQILDEITSLYENKVGKVISNDELKKMYAEGKSRYDQQIPPGYKDAENKRKRGDRHVYGDYIIWRELIDLIKKEKKPLVFVTDDRKEDWWTIENGKTVRPREELIKEFFDETGIRILIYNADNFLHYAKEQKLVPEINENTIAEVKEVRKSDELRNLYDALSVNIKNNVKLADLAKLFAKSDMLFQTSNTIPTTYLNNLNNITNVSDTFQRINYINDVLSKYREKTYDEFLISKAFKNLENNQLPSSPNKDEDDANKVN